MTFSFLRSRTQTEALEAGPDARRPPMELDIPAETEARRKGPYTKAQDVGALYRAATAAGGATAMVQFD